MIPDNAEKREFPAVPSVKLPGGWDAAVVAIRRTIGGERASEYRMLFGEGLSELDQREIATGLLLGIADFIGGSRMGGNDFLRLVAQKCELRPRYVFNDE